MITAQQARAFITPEQITKKQEDERLVIGIILNDIFNKILQEAHNGEDHLLLDYTLYDGVKQELIKLGYTFTKGQTFEHGVSQEVDIINW